MVKPSPQPRILFERNGKHYDFAFKKGCNAGITIQLDGEPTLYGGWTEEELADLMAKADEMEIKHA